MLNLLIRSALNNRFVVLAAALFISIYGFISVNSLTVDVFPDITKPTVTIMTEAHGFAPEEVELRVTAPIEQQLGGLPGLERTRSQSGIGLSVIYAEFEWGTDIYRNRQLVQERLSLVSGRLPQGMLPMLGPVGSLMGQIQQIALYDQNPSASSSARLRSLAEWTLRPRLLAVPGVAQVIPIGGGLKQYQIKVDPEKLSRVQISIEELEHQLSQLSQNTTGGFLEQNQQEFLIRHIGAVNELEDIKKTIVGTHFGRAIKIEDIAEVIEGVRLKRGDGSYNTQSAVILTVQKQPGADTVKISAEIERVVSELKKSWPDGVEIKTDVFQQAKFIENSINGIKSKLQWGSILVFIVLFIFLANLKLSLITMVAIPLSFLVSALVLSAFGMSVNTMTLGGLAIAIGELVDDSIVDAENIFRRLRENAALSQPLSARQVIFSASSEVRNSIVLSTAIIALVFVPLFGLSGLEGRLFMPLGFAYLTALLASLVISLTITPVLCSFLLKNVSQQSRGETRLISWLKKLDKKILLWALPRTNLILAVVGTLLVLSLYLFFKMGRDFLPQFNEGTAMIAVISPPGISLNESNLIGITAEKTILRTPEVKSVSRRTGRAEMDEHAMGVNISEIDVDFKKSSRTREEILNEIRNHLKAELPSAGINVGQPIAHLIDHMLSGVSAAVVIKIFGPELSMLQVKSRELQKLIEDVEGLVDLRVEQQGLIPQVKVQILRDEAARFGLSSGEVTELLETAFNGKSVGQIAEADRYYDVFLQFSEKFKTSAEQMERAIIKTMPDGRRVELKDVADVYESTGPNEINRENSRRRIVVSANVSGRDLASVVEEIQSRIDKNLQLPEGYHIAYDGQFENQRTAGRRIFWLGLMAILGVALLLYSHFRSSAICTQIMLTIPFALIGGVALLYFVNGNMTVPSLVGFIALCGIASRNGIMMISHYLHLMKDEGHSFSKEMIIKGSQERLVPVMMTALVATLALLPLVFARNEPGSEILNPVAVVIVGGLVSSTLLDIVVTPAVFYRFGRKSAEAYINTKNEEKV